MYKEEIFLDNYETFEDAIFNNLSCQQVTGAFMVAKGFDSQKIAKKLEVTSKTVTNWKNNYYFNLLVTNIMMTSLYANYKEIVALRGAMIKALTRQFDSIDVKTSSNRKLFRDGLSAVQELLLFTGVKK